MVGANSIGGRCDESIQSSAATASARLARGTTPRNLNRTRSPSRRTPMMWSWRMPYPGGTISTSFGSEGGPSIGGSARSFSGRVASSVGRERRLSRARPSWRRVRANIATTLTWSASRSAESFSRRPRLSASDVPRSFSYASCERPSPMEHHREIVDRFQPPTFAMTYFQKGKDSRFWILSRPCPSPSLCPCSCSCRAPSPGRAARRRAWRRRGGRTGRRLSRRG